MTVSAGRRLGPYEIVSPLGAGGMGEVYRARDTRLGREVAVKVLPAHLARDPDRRARFEREARAVSALNHPHICTIHDIGRQDGIDYIVMEHLEGETLADRLAKGALPQEQALRIGAQVADALDKAHRAGIVHRDLKPGNVMLTKTGAKLLDFGLARVAEPAGIGGGGLSTFPTQAKPLTEAGSLLGTFQYMAPEQLEGKDADARTDIFALGSVLYEMLTGKRAFEGRSQASLIAAILEREPEPIATLQPMTPPALDRLVRKCLAKNPDGRWQAAADVADELRWIADGGAQAGASAPAAAGLRQKLRLAWGLAAVLAALAAGLAWRAYGHPRPPSDARSVRSFILPPEKAAFRFLGSPAAPPALSPDGRRLVYGATAADGRTQLFVQSLDSVSAQALAGTDQASYPFWSPDGRFVGFFAQGKLEKIDASGGPARTLCAAPAARGGSWGRDGTILFGGDEASVYRVASEGGDPRPATKLDPARHDTSHRWPHFLPDGRRFLYLASAVGAEQEGNTLFVAALDGGEDRPLFSVSSNVAYSSGRLLFVRDRTLIAQPFDAARALPSGDALPLAERVQYNPAESRAVFSVSDDGLLVYQSGEDAFASQLAWFDRAGRPLGLVGGRRAQYAFRISPDGRRVAAGVVDSTPANLDIWIDDLSRGVTSRLTSDPGRDFLPAWSPDGSRIAFSSSRNGPDDLYVKAASGDGAEELLLHSDAPKWVFDWSPDGQSIAYRQMDPKTRYDIWILPLGKDGKPFPFQRTEFREWPGEFSPDGKWMAFVSDETGRREVYVAPFPGPGGKRLVSSAGGTVPRWRRDGKEIFYVSADQVLMAVGVKTGSSFESAVPVPLFSPRFATLPLFDVSPDGRFLIETGLDQEPSPLTLVVNWTAGLER